MSITPAEARRLSVPADPKVGRFMLAPGAGVLQALTAAGGLTEFAHADRIFVTRAEPNGSATVRIRFSYPTLLRSDGQSALFKLKVGDQVVVE